MWQGDTTDNPGDLLEGIFDDYSLHQLVSEPTHFSGDSATCIDLVVTNQPNLINECSIKPSLHTTCHHQINHKLTLTTHPYLRIKGKSGTTIEQM